MPVASAYGLLTEADVAASPGRVDATQPAGVPADAFTGRILCLSRFRSGDAAADAMRHLPDYI
jgi:hypothetical protein